MCRAARIQLPSQNQRDLPRDITPVSVVVLRYEKRSKSENKGKVPTKIELVLEQTKQERFDTSAGNPVKEILLKLNLPDHRILKDGHGAAEGRPAVQQHTTIETVLNMTPENKEHFQSEKEAIFLLLTASTRMVKPKGKSLATSAAAQPYSDTYYQAPKPQRSNATSSSTRQSASTRHKGKEVGGTRKCKRIWHSLQSISRSSTNLPTTTFELLQTPGTRLKIPHQGIGSTLQLHGKDSGVSPEESSSTGQPLEQVQNHDESNVYNNVRRYSEQPESINITYVLKKDDSNVTPDSSNICTNDNQVDQNAVECVDECAALANLTLDTEENKTILKQLKKANASFDSKNSYLKENTKVISDLKVKEDKDIDKMIEYDKQLKFLNEIVYTRNQSIQTIHMLAPKCATYNGRLTFANPRYLKKAQSEKPCLYEIPFDTSDPANRFAPDREETMTLDNESRSKLNKDYVKPYDYTKQN
ncbi:hypothetical protein Tco_0924218 [Tanacetum coccineum]|uniref:Uncharacterized protein n=1 Tax=Tanacetum coccineum TaxID=301880 RepID=A0ABQ5D4A9_9ASTR